MVNASSFRREVMSRRPQTPHDLAHQSDKRTWARGVVRTDNDASEAHPLDGMGDTRMVDFLAEPLPHKVHHVLADRNGIVQNELRQRLAYTVESQRRQAGGRLHTSCSVCVSNKGRPLVLASRGAMALP